MKKMKNRTRKPSEPYRALLLAIFLLGMICIAEAQEPEALSRGTSEDTLRANKTLSEPSGEPNPDGSARGASQPADEFRESKVGASVLKNMLLDQKSLWTAPARLHWSDGAWLFPLAAVTAGFFATDRSVPPALSTNPNVLGSYRKFSDYGAYSLVGAGAGFYAWGQLARGDHQRETGILAGEAALDSLAADLALKYAFGRQRPYEASGVGNFFARGDSFPSEHAGLAWSIASVLAHEYPAPLTQALVYSLATAVSASRVLGKEHFPSDVVVGGALGWLIGRQVYRAHHDPELPGGAATGKSADREARAEDSRRTENLGSTFVPLDSWTYAAFERLAALGATGSAILGQRPWTRLECARLTEEAAENLPQEESLGEEAARLESRLAEEFAYEIDLLNGGRNFTANLESAYTRVVSISGPPLTDSYHFGQTVAYDFGRPFERGTNGQAGGSLRAAAGPLALYVRAEYQHAPAAPALSDSVRNVMAQADFVSLSEVHSGPTPEVNRLELLDAYATVNINNWQLVVGRQSLAWAAGPDSLTWSDNIEPVEMVRLTNPTPFRLPGFLARLGPIRVEQFFGRLEGHPYVARPFVYGQKISLKIFPFLEIGVGRRSMIGGRGGDPLTAGNLGRSLLGLASPALNSVPGDNDSEMDWVFDVPGVRHYLVLYGDAYAEDDVLPIENPARNPWHPGLYLTRFPGIPRLDFHIEGVSTESPCALIGAGNQGCGGNHGLYNYWNDSYRDGNTNNGNLIGNTVGREGRAVQAWLRYWLTPQNTWQLAYKNSTVSADFIPGGGAWQDYSASQETHLANGFYVKSAVQFERISRYAVLFRGPRQNLTATLEVGFAPKGRQRNAD
jgi:membrane-associated phospholipid phosphatase